MNRRIGPAITTVAVVLAFAAIAKHRFTAGTAPTQDAPDSVMVDPPPVDLSKMTRPTSAAPALLEFEYGDTADYYVLRNLTQHTERVIHPVKAFETGALMLAPWPTGFAVGPSDRLRVDACRGHVRFTDGTPLVTGQCHSSPELTWQASPARP